MSFWNELAQVAAAAWTEMGKAVNPDNHYRQGYEDGFSGAPRRQMVLSRSSNPAFHNFDNVMLHCRDAYNSGYEDGVRERLFRRQ